MNAPEPLQEELERLADERRQANAVTLAKLKALQDAADRFAGVVRSFAANLDDAELAAGLLLDFAFERRRKSIEKHKLD